MFLIKSTQVNVISIVIEKAVETEVYSYLLTFCHDKGLTSSFFPFSFHHSSVHLVP